MELPAVHVVQVISGLDNESAGTTVWLLRLVDQLRRDGVCVDVLTLRADNTLSSELDGVGLFPRDAWSVPGTRTLLASRALRRAILTAGKKGHVLHSNGLWRMPNVYPGWVAARVGCPLVISPHGMLGSGALQFSASKKRLFAALVQNRALAAVTCFHATSDKEIEDIRAYGLKAPVAMIPNGIDVPDDSAVPLAKVQGAGGRRKVLYLGRVHPIKGLDRLIAAWERLEDRFDAWDLHIVGPSEIGHGDALKAETRRKGLKNVTFNNGLFGGDKLQAYRDADIFVLPTLHENFGMVVAEALAAGTPVIATKGAPWEGLATNRCGWWVDHGVDPLVATLSEAMSMPRSDLDQMGARGRDWMIRDFSWTRIAADMEDLYRWCQNGGDPPAFVTLA